MNAPPHRSDAGYRERFWSRVAKGDGDGCWNWTGLVDSSGYGLFSFHGRRERATRVAWALSGATIPPGTAMCHRCDNPPCVRPDHLFTGTTLENMRDMANKGRSRHGERQNTAKLTSARVMEIRGLTSQGASFVEVAARYGVTPQNIGLIARGATWKRLVAP